ESDSTPAGGQPAAHWFPLPDALPQPHLRPAHHPGHHGGGYPVRLLSQPDFPAGPPGRGGPGHRLAAVRQPGWRRLHAGGVLRQDPRNVGRNHQTYPRRLAAGGSQRRKGRDCL
ncbi:MAG: hypothetical protein AVDCRST_MAG56-440, partial [uncultured Cytophagales bacterium]